MISMDPPGHVHLRKLANKAFVPSKIKILVDRTYEVANELIDDIIAKHGQEGEFDFATDFCALYPVTVIAQVLGVPRSEEHTSELQSLMRLSYAVFCLKKKNYSSTYTLAANT